MIARIAVGAHQGAGMHRQAKKVVIRNPSVTAKDRILVGMAYPFHLNQSP